MHFSLSEIERKVVFRREHSEEIHNDDNCINQFKVKILKLFP